MMAKPRILVVEDEVIVARDLQQSLAELGYPDPAIAISADEAIARVLAAKPDLALMDIHLKGDRDGIDAADELRTRFDIPVVYVTAYADSTTLERAKVTQPFGYILKPCTERELQTSIEISLYKHRMEQELREAHRVLQEAHDEVSRQLLVASGRDRLVQAQMAGPSVQAAYDEIQQVFADALPVQEVLLYVPRDEGDGLVAAAAPVNKTEVVSGADSSGLVDQAYHTGRPQCDAGRCRAAVPILYNQRPLAVLRATVSDEAGSFSKSTLNCMCSLASQAALLLRMARITNEIRHDSWAAEQLVALSDEGG